MPKKANLSKPVTPRAAQKKSTSKKTKYENAMSFIGYKKDDEGNIFSLSPNHQRYNALKYELVHGEKRSKRLSNAEGLAMNEQEHESIKLSQAERVIVKFGGPKAMADLLRELDTFSGTKWSASTVYRWLYPRSKNGTNGIIPQDKMEIIKRVARYCGVHITEDDLLPFPK